MPPSRLRAFSFTPGFSPVFTPPHAKTDRGPSRPAALRTAESRTITRESGCPATPHAKWTLLLALVLSLLAIRTLAQTAATETNSAQFRVVDIFVDSKDQPLAAYQIEFSATAGDVKIVGIEGGGHPAFAEPPFYDPKAMQHERVVIAAFSTNPADQLPKGKTRVATIHLQISGVGEFKFETKLQAVAGTDGKKIEAVDQAEERKKS